MGSFSDAFTRNDGALGNAPTGHLWKVLQGTCAVRSGRGFATNGAPPSIAVVDSGPSGQDGSLSCDVGQGGGYALYFRVADVGNWWRMGLERTTSSGSYFVATGGYTCQNRLNNGEVGPYEQSPADSSGPYTDANGNVGYRFCTQNGYYQGYTSVSYVLSIEKCVAGVVSPVRSSGLSASPTRLKVSFNGSGIVGSTDSQSLTSITDSFNAGAGWHGFGYTTSTSDGNTDGIDNIAFSSVRNATYVPAVML